MKNILENAEFLRLFRSKMRFRTFITICIVGVLMYGSVLVGLYLNRVNIGPRWLMVYFFIIAGMQLAVSSLYGLMLSSQNVTLEKERNTYEFQRLVAMGPWRLATGKVMGSACESHLIALIGFFFAMLPVAAQAVPASVYFESQLVVVVWALTTTSIGLMCSCVAAKSTQSSGLIVLSIIGLLTIFIPSLGGSRWGADHLFGCANPTAILGNLSESIVPGGVFSRLSFFSIPVPPILGFLLVNLYFIALCFMIIVRRLNDAELSFISRGQAIAVFGVLQLLLVVDGSDSLRVGGYSRMHWIQLFQIFNLLALIAMAFALTPSAELLRGRIARGVRDEHWRILREGRNPLEDSPAISSMFILAAIYGLVAVVLTLATGATAEAPIVLAIPMVASAGMGVTALLLYIQVYTDTGGFKAAFVVVLMALVLPPVLLGICAVWSPDLDGAPALLSPFAYIAVADRMDHYGRFMSNGLGLTLACPLLCVAMAVLLTVLAAMRIRFLLDMKARVASSTFQPPEQAVTNDRNPVENIG